MARIRTFVAIEIPSKVRTRAASVANGLRTEGDPFRWVEADNLHLTLKFLGEVEDRDVYQICQSVKRVAAELSPFSVEISGVGAFPKLEKPRVVWLGVDEPENHLESLFAVLEDAMADHGFPREPRKFKPHVTLGRLRQGRRSPADMASQIRRKIEFKAGDVPVSELVVFSSELTSAGPLYTAMGRAPLAS